MYHRVKIDSGSSVPVGKNVIKSIPENQPKIKGMSDDSCTITTVGVDNKPAIAIVVDSVDPRTTKTIVVHQTHQNNELTKGIKDIQENINENKLKDIMVSDDTCDVLDREPAVVAVTEALVLTLGDDKSVDEVNKSSLLEMSKRVVNQPESLAEHEDSPLVIAKIPSNNKNYELSMNESLNAADDEKYSTEKADLVNRLRLSKNPSVRKLKVIAFVLPIHKYVTHNQYVLFLLFHRKSEQ